MDVKNKSHKRAKVFGIVNLSPESFSYAFDTADSFTSQKVLDHACDLSHAVDVLDIGALSTRPGAELLSTDLELQRFKYYLPEIITKFKLPISVDCYRPEVLKPLLESFSPEYINDVSGFSNSDLVKLAAESNAQIIVMHSAGVLPAMANVPDDYYASGLFDDLARIFAASIAMADKHGIASSRLILDPGLGFAKNLKHSLELLALIPKLRSEFGLPIFIGASRKSFLMRWFELAVARLGARDYKHGLLSALLEIAEEESGLVLDHDAICADFFKQYPATDTEPDELELRDKLSAVYNRLALDAGAGYLRVHNTKSVLFA